MNRARAELRNRRQMFGRAVAFMLREAIGRKLRVKSQHQPVARDLAQHARGGDGITPRIALHNRRLERAHNLNLTTIHRRVLRLWIQFFQRVVHRAMRGL